MNDTVDNDLLMERIELEYFVFTCRGAACKFTIVLSENVLFKGLDKAASVATEKELILHDRIYRPVGL